LKSNRNLYFSVFSFAIRKHTTKKNKKYDNKKVAAVADVIVVVIHIFL